MKYRDRILRIAGVGLALIITAGTGVAAIVGPDSGQPDVAVVETSFQAVAFQVAAAPPIAVDDAYSINGGAGLIVPVPGVLANDSDPDGQALTVRPVTGPAPPGSLTISPNGSFTYDPRGATGTVTFTYTAWDGALASNIATVTITVGAEPPPGSPAPSVGPALDGAELFASSCAACHGAGGIPLDNTVLSNAQLVSITTAGKGGMPPFGSILSGPQIQAIAAYIGTLGAGAGAGASGGGGGTPSPSTPPLVPTGGQAIYIAFCASCHGADGLGTLLGPGIVGESFSDLIEVVRRGDDAMPAFPFLKDSDLRVLAEYVASFGSGGDDDDHDDDDHDDDDHDDDDHDDDDHDDHDDDDHDDDDHDDDDD